MFKKILYTDYTERILYYAGFLEQSDDSVIRRLSSLN